MRASIFSALAVLALVACSDTDGAQVVGNVAPTEPIGPEIVPQPLVPTTARLRLVHASSDAPAFDVYVAGQQDPVMRSLKYGDASAYLSLPAGNYTFEMRAAGSIRQSQVLYTTETYTLNDNARLTAVATGLVNTSENDARFRVLPYFESTAVGSTRALARFIHASPDAPTVSIDIDNDDPRRAEVQSISRFMSTPESAVALPAGRNVSLGLVAYGNRYTSFTTPILETGSQLFVIAVGRMSQLARATDGLSLLVVGPSGSLGFIKQDPAVYMMNASPDAPSLDYFFQGYQLVNSLSYGELSSMHQMPPSNGTALDVLPAGYGASCNNTYNGTYGARVQTQPLLAGERYLLVTSGFYNATYNYGSQQLQVLTMREGFDIVADGRARIRVVNASPDAPAIDVGPGSQSFATTRYATGISFGQGSFEGGLVFDVPQSARIGFAQTGSYNAQATFDVKLWNANNAILVAAGSVRSGWSRSRLFAVNTSTFPWSVSTVYPSRY